MRNSASQRHLLKMAFVCINDTQTSAFTVSAPFSLRVNKKIQLTIDLGGDANRNGLFIANNLSFKPRKPTIQSLSLIFGEDYNFGKIEDGWCIAFLIILIIHTLFSYLKYRYICDKVQGLIDPGFIGNLNLSIILLVLWLEL